MKKKTVCEVQILTQIFLMSLVNVDKGAEMAREERTRDVFAEIDKIVTPFTQIGEGCKWIVNATANPDIIKK